MADIVVNEWLTDNSLRAYPFKESGTRQANTGYVLSNDLVLDMHFFSTLDDVRLLQILNTGTSLVFTFTGGFVFVTSDLTSSPQYRRNEYGLIAIGAGISSIPIGTHIFTDVYLEASTIIDFTGPWLGVNNISFDNNPTKTDDITLVEGYQMSVDIVGNQILLGADSTRGVPLECTSLSEIAENCHELISTINGVAASSNNVLYFSPGPGIVIYEDPTNHRIYIGFTFTSVDDICKTVPPNVI